MKILIILPFILCVGAGIHAQDVQARLDEAMSSYRSDDLENTRFALQEALTEINREVGREILAALPAEMNSLPMIEDEDNVTGMNSSFAGLFVHRSYRGENRSASIDIVSDSPMMAGINTILAMPGFMTSDDNQKRVKVSNYKALLTKNESETGEISWDLQVPLNSSLLTFGCKGFTSESEVMDMANQLPVKQIVEIAE